jgi:hypothetical protein
MNWHADQPLSYGLHGRAPHCGQSGCQSGEDGEHGLERWQTVRMIPGISLRRLIAEIRDFPGRPGLLTAACPRVAVGAASQWLPFGLARSPAATHPGRQHSRIEGSCLVQRRDTAAPIRGQYACIRLPLRPAGSAGCSRWPVCSAVLDGGVRNSPMISKAAAPSNRRVRRTLGGTTDSYRRYDAVQIHDDGTGVVMLP